MNWDDICSHLPAAVRAAPVQGGCAGPGAGQAVQVERDAAAAGQGHEALERVGGAAEGAALPPAAVERQLGGNGPLPLDDLGRVQRRLLGLQAARGQAGVHGLLQQLLLESLEVHLVHGVACTSRGQGAKKTPKGKAVFLCA